MSKTVPSFWESEYLIKEDFNMRLRDDAPEELKEEFKKWMEENDCLCLENNEKKESNR
ncbi:MAG: hypothetical protein MJ250_08545 [Alphaproteobacteria bacterium]|nr:hypothetical protein [Alphaproteobacteria bacterium]